MNFMFKKNVKERTIERFSITFTGNVGLPFHVSRFT